MSRYYFILTEPVAGKAMVPVCTTDAVEAEAQWKKLSNDPKLAKVLFFNFPMHNRCAFPAQNQGKLTQPVNVESKIKPKESKP